MAGGLPRDLRRILLISASSSSMDAAACALVAAGHGVVSAKDGPEARKAALAHLPDLVLVEGDLGNADHAGIAVQLQDIPGFDAVPIIPLPSIDGALAVLQEQNRTLHESNRRLEHMARLRRDFLRNITHELATPLTPVIGYVGLLLEEQLGPLSPLQKQSLTSMRNSAERLRFLIDTLLDMSLLESGSMHFYESAYDFAHMAGQAVDAIQPRAQEANVRVRARIPGDSLAAMGDSEKLRRAVLHVLDNAIKFTPRGGKVAVEVVTETDAGDVYYVIRIADSGAGIDAEQLEHIFEPFYQVDGSPTRAHGGMGLGLAFARRVARAFGGDAKIESPPVQSVAGLSLRGTAVTLSVRAKMPSRSNPDKVA
ncbi:MAG: hybrid sensor histidine kinase/response regulator [Myxococcales bacterium]|nr:hybrid sensor histidine kinase/response regulator [Myxococcales bacterium]MCB9708603.1 hybrid sensor histidine kinase/response regulator [Myxococcales bacterium]